MEPLFGISLLLVSTAAADGQNLSRNWRDRLTS